jgi:hypothetical protein
MTTTILTRGVEWSSSTLHDRWGDNVTDEQVTELGKLVVSRFEKLTEAEWGVSVHWLPSTSEVRGPVAANTVFNDIYLNNPLDGIRGRATSDVWRAVIGYGGPMAEAVNEIFQEVTD